MIKIRINTIYSFINSTQIKYLSTEIHKRSDMKTFGFIAYLHKRAKNQFFPKSEKQLYIINVQRYKHFEMDIYTIRLFFDFIKTSCIFAKIEFAYRRNFEVQKTNLNYRMLDGKF